MKGEPGSEPLPQGQERVAGRLAIPEGVPAIAHDPDNFQLPSVRGYLLANRALPRPQPLRERFIDDRYRGIVDIVSRREPPARDQGHSVRCEEHRVRSVLRDAPLASHLAASANRLHVVATGGAARQRGLCKAHAFDAWG